MEMAKLFRQAAACSGGIAAAVLFQSLTREAHCRSKSSDSEPPETVSVYLTKSSREELAAYLKSKSFKELNGSEVVIRRIVGDGDGSTYEPLFGERAAFRLKGIVTDKDQRISSGFGRVSIMTGEVEDEEVKASLPLFQSHESEAISTERADRNRIDLPSQLFFADVMQNRRFWTGRIRPLQVLDSSHGAVRAESVSFAPEEQLVVDGYICGSKYFDREAGECSFDRSTITASESAPTADSRKQLKEETLPEADAAKSMEVNKATSVDAEKRECPVCRYMKAGPCNLEFVGWDECIQNLREDQEVTVCFDVTYSMMQCMKRFEYYDLMTAGMTQKLAAMEILRNSNTNVSGSSNNNNNNNSNNNSSSSSNDNNNNNNHNHNTDDGNSSK